MNGNRPVVLYHVGNTDKGEKVEALCRRLSLQAREVKNEESAKTVEMLCGKTLLVSKCSTPPEKNVLGELFVLPELLVFADLTDEQLDCFLAEYRKAGMEAIPLKAVMTSSNRSWSLARLCMELMKEHLQIENAGRKKSQRK